MDTDMNNNYRDERRRARDERRQARDEWRSERDEWRKHHVHKMHWHPIARVGAFMAGLVGVAVIAFLIGWVVMLLWNALLPVIFHLPKINYWQAVGLIILARILLAPFNPHPKPGKQYHVDCGDMSNDMNRESWNEMWRLKGGPNKWKYYGEYWRDKGKTDFEQYVADKEKTDETDGDAR